ncbi:MAG: lysophospholipase [Actinomycetota bacterium]|nr:lysophospholipase [Actinomycetota bacterium]
MTFLDLPPGHTERTVTDFEGLRLHAWAPRVSQAVIAYFHGLQSHASWSWELALDLTARGETFLCLDRRGSGLSPGPHDEFPEADQVVEDSARFLRHSLAVAHGRPVVAVGHCLGGSVLTATLSRHPEILEQLASMSLVSTWLGRMSQTLSEDQLRSIRDSRDEQVWDAGLRAEDFTAARSYRTFIEEDPLAVTGVRQRTRKNVLALEDAYRDWTAPPGTSAHFVSAFDDPVIDVRAAARTARRVYGDTTEVHLLGTDRHYLPFTPARASLVRLLHAQAVHE